MKDTTIAVGLAKNVFEIAISREAGKVSKQLRVSRPVLPALPAGWIYEGWVVGPEGPVSTGRFTQVMGADSDAGGPTAGPRSTPPFPGQDFIMPPVSLIGYQAVVSIETRSGRQSWTLHVEAAGGHEHSRRWAGRPPAHGQHGDRLPNRDRYPLICVLRAGRQSEAGSPSLSRPVPKLGPFEIDHKSAA